MKQTVIVSLILLTTSLYGVNLPRLIDRTQNKVVKIGIISDKGRGVCSGAFISESGMVLTCAHCFSEGTIKKVFIKTSTGFVDRAYLLKIDPEKDLAIIVPASIGPFPYFNLGKEPRTGQQVLSFGSPLGIQNTSGVGWVSNVLDAAERIILHSSFINPGNSGGPLVDLKGDLVGVNEALLTYGFLHLEVAQGLYVAISVDTVREFIQEP